MYGTMETLRFKGFGGLLYAQRLFHRKSTKMVTGERRLDLAGWNEILELPEFSKMTVKIIDALYMPDQEEIEEAALLRLGRPVNEKDYLVSFLQKN